MQRNLWEKYERNVKKNWKRDLNKVLKPNKGVMEVMVFIRSEFLKMKTEMNNIWGNLQTTFLQYTQKESHF